MTTRTITRADWIKEGEQRFGADQLGWAFVCPSCGHVARVHDWKEAGAGQGEVAFSCVGRHRRGAADMLAGKSPCNYAGGGLIRLNPVTVVREDGTKTDVFEFAPKATGEPDPATSPPSTKVRSSRRRRPAKAAPAFVCLRSRVWYKPKPSQRYAAVVASEPWLLGGHTWVVRLEGLGDDYRSGTGRQESTIAAAACDCLESRFGESEETP